MLTGVLWLLLWYLVVEALIARLSGGEIHIQGYAMTFVYLWWENSQTKCHGSCNGPIILSRHDIQVGLSANPDKTEFVVFTRRTPHCLQTTLFQGYFKSLFVSQVSQGNPGFLAKLKGACGC